MNSILSIIVALAMLFSGGFYAETPEAASSRTLTISDVVVTIDGEDFVLNPTLSVGMKTEGQSALLDVAMHSGEDTLFPMQGKLDASGASVLVADSASAYTFSPELLGLDELLTEEDLAMLDPLVRMLSDIPNLTKQQYDAAAYDAMGEQLMADAEVTETTYNVDGTDVPASRVVFTVDHQEFLSLLDAIIESYEGEFFDAYIELINDLGMMTGAFGTETEETAVPQIEKISDLYAQIPMTLEMDFDLVITEDSIGEGTMNCSAAMDMEGETMTMEIPCEIYFYGPESFELGMEYALPEEMGSMAIVSGQDGEAHSTTASVFVNDGSENGVSFNMSMAYEPQEDGVAATYTYYEMMVEDMLLGFEYAGSFDAAGMGFANIAAGYEDGMNQYGVTFTATVSDEEIVDRIAAVPTKVLTTEEEIENENGLMLSVMGLAGDAEKLMAEPSVAALMEKVGSLMYAVDDVVLTEENTEYVEGDYPDGTDDPSVLSFAIPEFNLPESFVLTEQYIYGEYNAANLVFENPETYGCIYIDLYGAEDSYQGYVLGEDGVLVLSETPVFSVQQSEGSFYAYTTWNGVEYSISSYDGSLNMEILSQIAAGL